MHAAAYAWVANHAQAYGRVVEFGGLNINGSVRALFGDATYCSIDLVEGPGVDVVADCCDVPLTDWDCVVCCEVLEHHPAPEKVIDAACRALAADGVFIMTCAGDGRAPHSAVDGGGLRPDEHYRNIAAVDLDEMLRAAGFKGWDINQQGEDLRCIAWR